jgi:phosphatidylserine synthase
MEEINLTLLIIDGIQKIIIGFVLLITSIISFRSIKKVKSRKYEEEATGIKKLLLFLFGSFCLFVALVQLLNIKNWLIIFYPELIIINN